MVIVRFSRDVPPTPGGDSVVKVTFTKVDDAWTASMTPTEVATAMLSKVVIGVMNISEVMYPIGPAIADVEGTPTFLGVSSGDVAQIV